MTNTIQFPKKIEGVIFDIDDTLLDNQAAVSFGTIHEVTRLRAVHHVAKKYNLAQLLTLTEQENYDAFLNAKVHSLGGAVWEVMYLKGVVESNEYDPEHVLLNEIITMKNELHADTLRELGRTVLGAVEFVHGLAEEYGIQSHMAIASSAIRRDINIFLDEMTDLRQYFPDERIVSLEDIPHNRGKPHPDPFNKAFALLHLPAASRGNVLAFEDYPRGVISAKKAGLYVCAITTRFGADHPGLLAANPDVIIDDYSDFIDHLRAR